MTANEAEAFLPAKFNLEILGSFNHIAGPKAVDVIIGELQRTLIQMLIAGPSKPTGGHR